MNQKVSVICLTASYPLLHLLLIHHQLSHPSPKALSSTTQQTQQTWKVAAETFLAPVSQKDAYRIG